MEEKVFFRRKMKHILHFTTSDTAELEDLRSPDSFETQVMIAARGTAAETRL